MKQPGDQVTVYQKPTCSTCRNLMMLLKEKGVQFDAVNYFIDPIPRDKLQVLIRKTGGTARDFIRTREPEYKSLGLENASDSEIIDALVANPSLVQRPIVEVGERAIIARPAERVSDIL
jgi:arsenate reductase